MSTILTNNLSTKTVSEGGGAWAPPTYVFGEEITLGLRLLENVNGAEVEPPLNVTGLRASIGRKNARPLSGTWKLQLGAGDQTAENTTAALPYEASALQVKNAIAALGAVVTAFGAPSVTKVADAWRIVMGAGGAEVPMQVRDNELWPVSAGQISAYQVNEVWRHQVMLTQAPVAETTSFARVLPASPEITPVQNGGSETAYSWNEVQNLFVNPAFRGTYILRWGEFARTIELSVADTAESVQAALETVVGAGNVQVANVVDDNFRIEFIGELAATDQPELVVEPLNPPPGDVTFTLKLDKAELLDLLWVGGETTLPLDVFLEVTKEDETVETKHAFRVDVTIDVPTSWPEMGLVPGIDYLRPLSPKNYRAFNPENVITGQQYFPAIRGNGAATSFVVDHGLDTGIVFVEVWDEVSGELLVHGTDYTVGDRSDNSVTVTSLVGAPVLNGWLIIVGSAQTVGAFAAGLEIEIDQVAGLDTRLNAIDTALSTLQALAPSTPLGRVDEEGALILDIAIAAREAQIGRVKPLGGLVPAIHTATQHSIDDEEGDELPDPEEHAGEIWVNDTAAEILLPGGGGVRGSLIAVGGFAGSDGRSWRPMNKRGATKSYFPRDFEWEGPFYEISAAMLRAGTTLNLRFQLDLKLLEATTRSQYVVVVEHAAVPSQSTPSTTSQNLEDFTWSETPLLRQTVYLGAEEVPHSFGVQVIRAANGTLSANQVRYKFTEAAGSVPASADFGLRVRLIDFDTQNSVAVPRGAVSIKLASGRLTIN